MNTENQILVNPNSASVDELTQVTGIGPDIARRIVNGRPYETLEDLTRINGIGPSMFEQIKSSLTLEPDEKMMEIEAEAEKETPELETVADPEKNDEAHPPADEGFPADDSLELPEEEGAEKTQDSDSNLVEEAPQVLPEPAVPPPGISRSSAIGWALFAGIVAMLLSIILSLGVIASINGGSLNFVTQTEYRKQQALLAEIDNRTDLLEGELAGMRERLTNLELLSGRISTVEKSVGAVQGEMDVAHERLDGLSGELEILTEQIIGLSADVETFKAKLDRSESFFVNMRNLLNNLFPEE